MIDCVCICKGVDNKLSVKMCVFEGVSIYVVEHNGVCVCVCVCVVCLCVDVNICESSVCQVLIPCSKIRMYRQGIHTGCYRDVHHFIYQCGF